MKQYDAIIIGFGKAGKTLAAELSNRGWQVAIVERSNMMYGGSCPNVACIPTKTLVHEAEVSALLYHYVSLDDFRIIRDQLFGDKKRDIGDRDPVQYAVFIDPPLAHIGISEEEALKRGYSFKVSRLPASSIVRTRTLRQTDGMLKAIINNHNGKIMGCTLFCADASEIINIVAMAIKTGQTSTFLRDFIFTHPSMSEGLNQLFDV